MQTISFFIQSNKKSATVKDTKTIPSNFITEPNLGDEAKQSNYQIAKELNAHMDIVAESRRLMQKGNTMTWEEFEKEHAQK